MLTINDIMTGSPEDIWVLFFIDITPYELIKLYDISYLESSIHTFVWNNLYNDYPWEKYQDIPNTEEFKIEVCKKIELYIVKSINNN